MNIDNNIVLSEKTEELSPITVSIPDGADVIVGQHIYLVVTVKSPQVKSIKSISIEDPKKNISVLEVVEDWKLINDTSGKAIFMLEVDDQLSPNKAVGYTVHAYSDKNEDVHGIEPLMINYKTKKINEWNFVSLKTDMEIIEIPVGSTYNPNGKYILYSGMVVDENNNPLKNTQIIVSSANYPGGELEMLYITTDPSSGKSPEIVKIQKREKFSNFFVINSDENGNVGFRIYPKRLTLRIEFIVEILGMNFAIPIGFAYVISASDSNPSVPPPQIIGILPGGIIKKETGVKDLILTVPKYSYPAGGDVIIFLIKDENNKLTQLSPTYFVKDNSKEGNYNARISYEKIPFNKKLMFYYLVIRLGGDSMYSKKLNVIFEDDSGAGTNPNNGGNTGNGNHCDNGLYNKVDVDSNYEDGKFSLKIKSITLI
ncbi:hypothetical protein [Xenorhabdus stockiae]|uniref:hypothetical protein n=1 Tax=Xenorhabdus stockiae TaxID=351614 RepID=UPI004063187A